MRYLSKIKRSHQGRIPDNICEHNSSELAGLRHGNTKYENITK